jgi:hypothetical protein
MPVLSPTTFLLDKFDANEWILIQRRRNKTKNSNRNRVADRQRGCRMSCRSLTVSLCLSQWALSPVSKSNNVDLGQMGPIALSSITDQPRLDGREGLEARQILGCPSRCTSGPLSKNLGFTWAKYNTPTPRGGQKN